MSKTLTKARVFATFLFATVLALTPVFTVNTVRAADKPELSLGDIVSDEVTNDPDGVAFAFESDQDGYIIYTGECVSDTIKVEADEAIEVTFNDVPDGVYAEGDCKVRVFNSEGDISDPLDVPEFTVDTKKPSLTLVDGVDSPFNSTLTQPSIKVVSDEKIEEITYGGTCDASNTTMTANTSTTLTLRDAEDEDDLDAGTYSDCTIEVEDEAGNKSAKLVIPEFELLDSDSIFIIATSGLQDPSDSSLADDSTQELRISASNAGQLYPTSASACEVTPNEIPEGSSTVTLHSLNDVNYDGTIADCDLTYTVQTAVFGSTGLITKTLNLDGDGTDNKVGNRSALNDATAPQLDGTEVEVKTMDNGSTIAFEFTSDEGGTWSITSASGQTCDVALTGATWVNNIVVPGENTILLEPVGSVLADATYNAGGVKCELTVTDIAGPNSDKLDIPEFEIDDTEGPKITVVNMTSSPVQSGGNVEVWFTIDEFVDTTSLVSANVELDGDCFDVEENTKFDTFAKTVFFDNTDFASGNSNAVDAADGAANTNGDLLPVGLLSEYNKFVIAGHDIEDGEYSGCQFRIEDGAGNKSNTVSIPKFTVGTSGPEFEEDPQYLSGTVSNPVTFTFESDSAGTFSFDSNDCEVNGEYEDIVMKKGVNTVTLDNLVSGAVKCDMILYTTSGVRGETLTDAIDLTVDVDEDPALKVVTETDSTALTFTFKSETNGDITYDGLCSSTIVRAVAGNNTVKFNKLPAGQRVDDCELTVTNNDDTDTLNVSTFTYMGTTEETLEVLPAGAVYRFINTDTGSTHFFTNDKAEAELVVNKFGRNYNQEESSFKADAYNNGCGTDAMPVKRYINNRTGNTHFYAIDTEEIKAVETTFKNAFTFEKVAFCAYETQKAGTIPVYRWNNVVTGDTHFYTASMEEKDVVDTKFSKVFKSEGVAFYATAL